MGKVKITDVQKETLERYLGWIQSERRRGEELTELEYFIENHEDWVDDFKPLKYFSVNDFSLILNGFYEVEQPFKVGDWVRGNLSKDYAKIKKIYNDNFEIEYTVKFEGVSRGLYPESEFINKFEKVTEPYKIMLLNLRRRKPEFATDDGKHYTIKTGQHVIECIQLFEEGLVEYFYPVESRIEVSY